MDLSWFGSLSSYIDRTPDIINDSTKILLVISSFFVLSTPARITYIAIYINK